MQMIFKFGLSVVVLVAIVMFYISHKGDVDSVVVKVPGKTDDVKVKVSESRKIEIVRLVNSLHFK